MNKKWKAVLSGVALVTASVFVVAAQPQKPRKPAPAQEPREAVVKVEPGDIHGLNTEQLERLQRKLEEQLARVEAELERKLGEVEAKNVEVDERMAKDIAALEESRALFLYDQADKQEGALARAYELADDPQVAVFMEDGESGWLGISINEVTAEKVKELKLPAERGVLVSEIEKDSAAAKAGLKVGDVITEFAGQHVEGTAQFRRMVRETPAGRTVQITVWRDGRSQNLSAQLGRRQEFIKEQWSTRVQPLMRDFKFEMPRIEVLPQARLFSMLRGPMLGITAEDLDGQLGAYFGAPDGEGVLVKSVNSGSPAEKAGIKAGDVIIKIEGERVRTVGDLREKMRDKREQKSVTVGLIRKGAETSVKVEIEQPAEKEKVRGRVMSRRISM